MEGDEKLLVGQDGNSDRLEDVGKQCPNRSGWAKWVLLVFAQVAGLPHALRGDEGLLMEAHPSAPTPRQSGGISLMNRSS
jgi:hypothetical protein